MRKQFEGKTFYVRGGWLDNELHFNQNGKFVGNSPKASYTLSLVEITRVHLDKHHLDLEGIRYGLHFLGAAPFEDQAVDRVRLTSKKKPLHIVIDREEVELPKKQKPPKPDKKKQAPPKTKASGQTVRAGAPSAPVQEAPSAPVQELSSAPVQEASSAPVQATPSAPVQEAPSAPVQTASSAPVQEAPSAPVQTASSAPVQEAPSAPVQTASSAPVQEAPSAPVQEASSAPVPPTPPTQVPPSGLILHGATVATSQAVANQTLRHTIDAVFASGIDQSMIATLPAYWQLYYKDVDLKQDYRPSDPSILPENQVDTKARLVSVFDPPSNEFAQKNGVAGMSMYHVVVQPDGKAGEVAIGRPIGFGLDESAVNAIRQAKFEPAIKDGKPVPVVLDLIVEFRIYSKLTDRAAAKPVGPQPQILPGPYSVDQPQAQSQRQ